MPAVVLEDVRKVYGEDTVALDGVSAEIPEGQFVVLLGPSGAGKSTLLRVLNGLTRPTDGRVEVDGRDPASGTGSEVGMVFQMHYLIENTSAFRNALTGALSRTGLLRSLLTWYADADRRAALEALETVGLLDAAGQRAGSMSGGQKQRVGIARALVQDPELLLADEPVSSLDPKAARDVMAYMKKAAAERGLTTVASLHQVNIAREFGDRFLGIRDGELAFDGTREDLTMDVVDRIYYGETPDGEATHLAAPASEGGPAPASDGGSSPASDGGTQAPDGGSSPASDGGDSRASEGESSPASGGGESR